MGFLSLFTEVLFVVGDGGCLLSPPGEECAGVLTQLQGLPHSSTGGFKHISEMTPSGKTRPLQRPQPQGTHLRLALNSHCKHKQCSQHPGEAISEHRHHCFWFRIKVLCLVISLQVSFQDSQDEHRVQGGEGHRAWHWGLTAWCPDTRYRHSLGCSLHPSGFHFSQNNTPGLG